MELKRATKNKKPKLVGRGKKRGKTAGRGTKGQRARAGHKIRPEIRDRIKKLPKLRGRGKNSFKAFRTTPETLNVSELGIFEKGAVITPSTLLEKGLIRRVKGVLPQVKILGGGDLAHQVEVYDCVVTDAAKAKIEAVGGIIK